MFHFLLLVEGAVDYCILTKPLIAVFNVLVLVQKNQFFYLFFVRLGVLNLVAGA